MKWKTLVSLVIALALGLVAAYVGRDLMAQNRGATRGNRVPVVVVQRDVQPGESLGLSDLGTVEMSAANVPPRSFKDPSALRDRVAMLPIVQGQIVMDSMLAPVGAAGGLQALVPKGMRAVTIEANEVVGMAGLLVPGARVDVVATLRRNNKPVVCTLAENVLVTAVGQRLSAKDKEGGKTEPAKTVTLVVSPKEAVAIQLAQEVGRPRLMLRGSGDQSPVAGIGLTLEELTSMEPDVLQAPAAAVPTTQPLAAVPATQPAVAPVVRRSVQIIRRGSESMISFENRRAAAEAVEPTASTSN